MLIFIIFILLCFFLEFLRQAQFVRGRNIQNLFIFLVTACLIIIIGCRDISIGTDTRSYVRDFRQFVNRDKFIWKDYKEPLFWLLIYLTSRFTDNYTIFLLIVAAFCVVSFALTVKRYSKWPFLSYIALLSLGFVYFYMAGLRQCMAISIVLLSYKYVRERKLIKFLLLMAIAYGFHNTVIVFLLIYPIAKLKIRIVHFAVIAGALLVTFLNPTLINIILFKYLKWERLASYEISDSINSLSMFIIQFCIMIFCMFYYKKVIKDEEQDLSLYNIMFVGLMFQAFTPIIAEFFRISMYFSIFNVVLISNAIMMEKNKTDKIILSSVIILLLLTYYFVFSGPDASIIPYKFAFR